MAFAFARPIATGASHWTNSVAEVVVSVLGLLFRPRRVQLIEGDDGMFSVHMAGDQTSNAERIHISDETVDHSIPPRLAKSIKGSRVELVLRPSRFLFRPLQLPGQAIEFLDGIVRAQIDRLTPWTPADSVFGWSKPEVGNNRLAMTIAVTARAKVTPLIQFVAGLGAVSIAVLTVLEGDAADDAKIKVFDQDAGGMLDVRRMSCALLAILAVCGAATAVSFAADMIVGNYLGTRQAELSQRIFARRAAIRIGGDSPNRSAIGILERRKHETAASVIVLEVLSRILPDHTYVTELRIDGNKVQIVGVTHDAPGLIRLIEQSSHFTRATFFAPTTRSPSDTGERFHIEAQIEPVNGPRT